MEQRYFLIIKGLLQIYGNRAEKLAFVVSEEEWQRLFEISQKQAVSGVVFEVIKQLPAEQQPPKEIYLKWFLLSERIKNYNAVLDESIGQLQQELGAHGLNCCILKGQGGGLLYPTSWARHPGDIDVWCKGGRNDIIGKLKDYKIEDIVIHHADIDIIKGVPVEVHFVPSWFYCPFTDRRFRKWYGAEADRQFENYNDKGFCSPTIGFNLVYSLVHIYKHLFDEGIGLRQLMDYYFILKHSTAEERDAAFMVLSDFKMKRFVGAVMYVMQVVFGLEHEFMLCKPSEMYGKHLLNDIMIGGNFGRYNRENAHGKENVIARGLRKMKRNMKVVAYYPSEVVWAPLWKCWHWAWRKYKGYL